MSRRPLRDAVPAASRAFVRRPAFRNRSTRLSSPAFVASISARDSLVLVTSSFAPSESRSDVIFRCPFSVAMRTDVFPSLFAVSRFHRASSSFSTHSSWPRPAAHSSAEFPCPSVVSVGAGSIISSIDKHSTCPCIAARSRGVHPNTSWFIFACFERRKRMISTLPFSAAQCIAVRMLLSLSSTPAIRLSMRHMRQSRWLLFASSHGMTFFGGAVLHALHRPARTGVLPCGDVVSALEVAPALDKETGDKDGLSPARLGMGAKDATEIVVRSSADVLSKTGDASLDPCSFRCSQATIFSHCFISSSSCSGGSYSDSNLAFRVSSRDRSKSSDACIAASPRMVLIASGLRICFASRIVDEDVDRESDAGGRARAGFVSSSTTMIVLCRLSFRCGTHDASFDTRPDCASAAANFAISLCLLSSLLR
eukprot:Opistho-2@69490